MKSQFLEFLLNLGLFNIKLGLSTIQGMLERLGNPHLHPRIIHFAGTNGKGSTLSTLEKLLLDAGYSTGSTVSPHLISYNERFRINGQPVSDEALNTAFIKVCKACDIDLALTSPVSKDGDLRPTFFEFSIAIAFELFRSFKVDYILLETGMGGRLDATNVVVSPIACVLTRIALDHQEYLGNSIEEITDEKLGILKNGSSVFVSNQEATVLQRILKRCRDEALDVYSSPKDFGFSQENGICTYRLLDKKLIKLKKQSLVGDYQKENTATALAVFQKITHDQNSLTGSEIVNSLQSVTWNGRLQFLNEKVLIDGAHNESGINALLSYLKKYQTGKKIIFAIAWKKDKTIENVLKSVQPDQFKFLPVEMKSDSAESMDTVKMLLTKNMFHVEPSLPVEELICKIKDSSLPEHDLLVVAGSLYLLGEFLTVWNKINKPIINDDL